MDLNQYSDSEILAAIGGGNQPVDSAIISQESSANPDTPDSSAGAIGASQIMPKTFARFAKPGEDIHNPQDNLVVGQRYRDYLTNRFGNDPARIATAYFSGEGNVAPPDSATPWIKDKPDTDGTLTSDYVKNVLKKMGNAVIPQSKGGENDNNEMVNAGRGRVPDGTAQHPPVSDSALLPRSVNSDYSQYSDDEIRAAAGLPPSASQNIHSDITGRALDTLQNIDKGSLGFLQLGGQIAGAGLNTAKEGVKAITPEPVKQGIQNIADWAGDKLLGSSAAPAINSAGNAIRGAGNAFAQAFPEGARNLQAAGNILATAPIAEGVAGITSALDNAATLAAKNDIGNPASSNIFTNTSGKSAPEKFVPQGVQNIFKPSEPPPSSLLQTDSGKPLLVAPKAIGQGASDLGEFLKTDGIDLNKTADDLEAAQKINPNVRAIDVMATDENGFPKGENILGLAKSIAQSPGQGRAMAGEMAGRGFTASQRIGDAFDSALSKQGLYQVSDDALAKMQQNAPPAYAKAFAAKPIVNDRIKEFLKSPEIQAGIKRGLQIQRIEGTADGKPFDPNDYGITSFNEAGDPVISATPNMRLLDAGKKGLDAMIQSEQNPLTGKVTEMGRALTKLKASYLNTLDAANPDYAAARSAYGDQASRLQALNNGRDFMSMDHEEIQKFIQDSATSNAEKAAFSVGARRALQDRLDIKSDTTNPIESLWKPSLQKRLQPLFPDKASFDNFAANMEHEKTMARVNKIMQGSPTAANLAFNEVPKTTPIGSTLRMAGNILEPGMLIGKLGDIADKALQKHAKTMSADSKAVAMRYLTTKDPQLLRYLARQNGEKATKH